MKKELAFSKASRGVNELPAQLPGPHVLSPLFPVLPSPLSTRAEVEAPVSPVPSPHSPVGLAFTPRPTGCVEIPSTGGSTIVQPSLDALDELRLELADGFDRVRDVFDRLSAQVRRGVAVDRLGR